jgi:hypothetical protein
MIFAEIDLIEKNVNSYKNRRKTKNRKRDSFLDDNHRGQNHFWPPFNNMIVCFGLISNVILLTGVLKGAADSKNISKSDGTDHVQIFMVAVPNEMFRARYAPIFMTTYLCMHLNTAINYKWLVLGDATRANLRVNKSMPISSFKSIALYLSGKGTQRSEIVYLSSIQMS